MLHDTYICCQLTLHQQPVMIDHIAYRIISHLSVSDRIAFLRSDPDPKLQPDLSAISICTIMRSAISRSDIRSIAYRISQILAQSMKTIALIKKIMFKSQLACTH